MVENNLPNGLGLEEKWIYSNNLANFLNLDKVKTISIPIAINVIFIGFSGDGKARLKLSQEYLSKWLHHAEHTIPHTTVTLRQEGVQGRQARALVEYDVDINVLEVSPMVNTIIQDHLYWYLRPEDVTGKTEGIQKPKREAKVRYYSDASRMSNILSSLLKHINQTDPYTLFVLNPETHLQSHEMYGYRTGFSDDELNSVYGSEKFRVENVEKLTQFVPQDRFAASTNYEIEEGQKEKGPRFKDRIQASNTWAEWYLSQMRNSSKIPSQDCEEEECAMEGIPTKKSITSLSQWIATNGNLDAKEYLYRAQNDPHMREDCLVDSWSSHQRFSFVDISAGVVHYGPTVSNTGYRSLVLQKPTDIAQNNSDVRNYDENSEERAESYRGEKMLMENLWSRKCAGEGQNDSPFCLDIKKKLDSYENRSNRGKDDTDWDQLISGSGDHYDNHQMSTDDITSKIGQIVSSYVHHLVLPPTPSLDHPFAERVLFHVHLVVNQGYYSPYGQGYFDLERFKLDVAGLKMPQQEFSFSLKEVSIQKDTQLALALKMSTKTARIAKLSADGYYSSDDVLYLDSTEIGHYLNISRDIEEESLGIRHIPIFLFSFGKSVPVFIDKRHQAKAINGAVLIVQSDFHVYESSLACNKKPIYWNLRNPIKAALSVTSTLLSGLLPPHIDYDDATGGASQVRINSNFLASDEWMWSVGNQPFSHTSSGHKFSQTQRDITMRNYVVALLNETATRVNGAIDSLSHIACTKKNLGALEFSPSEQLVEKFYLIKDRMSDIARLTAFFDPSAITQTQELLILSDR
ncbi:hypothetical protein PROFUN_00871 [Planoprotostelium fungivorum]|uniref:DUF7906 domain-containing protein n=1 Tax=Planoprotostelium fungivorum TaxID=1890364 RepID=A0A2P6P096_9EUKA|nr:hypothetical protein PROFUN_00871 [Planoprotostelium fungivorum]